MSRAVRIYLHDRPRECAGNRVQLYSSHKHAWRVELLDGIRLRWKLEANGKLAHATPGSSSSLDSQLLPPPCVSFTDSFRVTPMYELCARVRTRALFSLLSRFTYAQPRVQMHRTQRRTRPTPPPTGVHPIASRFLSRAAPPYTLTRRFLRSLSRTLSPTLEILVTHLPIISQSS